MHERSRASDASSGERGRGRRALPAPETTQAEATFFLRQIEQHAPLVFKLRDGETLRGVVEWQDRGALRVALADGGHVILQKHAVATIHRVADET